MCSLGNIKIIILSLNGLGFTEENYLIRRLKLESIIRISLNCQFFSLAHYNRVFSREHKNNNIKSEWFRLYKGELPDSAIIVREHYKNLFELPIFFFLLCIILYLLDRVESIDVILAWVFVCFKILHSFVRLTTNNTRTRAFSFTICYFSLLFGWILLVFKLIVY